MEPENRIKVTKRCKHCCLGNSVYEMTPCMQLEQFMVPGTLDESLHPQDLVPDLQKLQLERHQTTHLHCAEILFDHEMITLPLYPEYIQAYY
jgi:hypothetical protein